jgi:hypothetical protein
VIVTGLFPNTLSAPRNVFELWFHKTILLAAKPAPSNRLPVCQSLAFDHACKFFHAFAVRIFSRIPTESKLINVFRQMLFADAVPCAKDAALEQAEKRFAIIYAGHGAVGVAAAVFVFRVNDRVVLFPFFQRIAVGRMFIRVHGCLFAHTFIQDFAQIFLRDVVDDLRPHISAALHKCHNRCLATITIFEIAFAADVGFVHFDNAGQFIFSSGVVAHCVTDAMAHEPSRFVSDFEHPVKLMRGHGFFARTDDEHCHKPFADWNVGAFKHRADSDRELFAAHSAEIKPFACRTFAAGLGRKRERINAFGRVAGVLAMRADCAVRPAQTLQKLTRRIVVGILLGERNQVQIVRIKRFFRGFARFNVIFHAINIGIFLRLSSI